MKICWPDIVRYSDLGPDGTLSIASIFDYLQEAATYHASTCGDSIAELEQRSAAWVLYKLLVNIETRAAFTSPLQVLTWSRGSKGLKAYRDFIISSGDVRIATARSTWVYLDRKTGSPQRIAAGHMERYGSEREESFDEDPDLWRPPEVFENESVCTLETRASDFDTNGHMNNRAYILLLESALHRHVGCAPSVRQVRIQYEAPVSPGTQSVELGLVLTEGAISFRIFGQLRTHARGELRIARENACPS